MILPTYAKYYRLDKPTIFKKRIQYSESGYIEKTVHIFKDKKTEVSRNYLNDDLLCILFYVTKAGEWVKSKLIYFKDGKPYKTLISDNKNKTVWNSK